MTGALMSYFIKVSFDGSMRKIKKPKKGETKMSVISMKQLLEAGVHFGP